MRKVVIDKREEYIKVKQFNINLETDLKDSMPDIVQSTGGSINNLPVKTKEFDSWLAIHQSNNPFIGKHVTSAPEYNVSQTDLGSSISDKPNEKDSNAILFEKIKANIPAFDVEVDIENICEAPKLNQNQDKKFIDMLLVESSAKKLASKSNEEIKDYSIQLMKSYHDDSNYNTSIDLDMVVEQSKVLAIESKKDEKKLIKSY